MAQAEASHETTETASEVACRFDGFPDGIVKYVMQRRLDRAEAQR